MSNSPQTDFDKARSALDNLFDDAPTTPGRAPAKTKRAKKIDAGTRAATTLRIPDTAEGSDGSGNVFASVPDSAKLAETARLPITVMGVSERVAVHYRDRLAYRPGTGWMVWADTHWIADDVKKPIRARAMVRSVIRSLQAEAAHAAAASEEVQEAQAAIDALVAAGLEPDASMKAKLVTARKEASATLLAFAAQAESWGENRLDTCLSDVAIYLTVDDKLWDAHPFKINAPNGTINLKHRDADGHPVLSAHNPRDYITKITSVAYVPGARHDDVNLVLEHFEKSGAGTANAITRYLGYSLTGAMEAKAFVSIAGPPNAAKSTLFEATVEAIGTGSSSYAAVVGYAALQVKNGGSDANPALDKARGARLLIINEAERLYMDGPLVKALSGGDRIYTRGLHENGSSWVAKCKILTIGNDYSRFSASDTGMMSRCQPIWIEPLDADQIDTNLRHRLRQVEQQTALLSTLVDAAVDWYVAYKEGGMDARDALEFPAKGDTVKAGLKADFNPLSTWLDEHVVAVDENDSKTGVTGRASITHLMTSFNEWQRRTGQTRRISTREFGRLLEAAGFGERSDSPTSSTVEFDGGRSSTVKAKFVPGLRMTSNSEWLQIVHGHPFRK